MKVNWKLFSGVTLVSFVLLFFLFSFKVVMVRLLFPIILLFGLLYMVYLMTVALIEPEPEKKEEKDDDDQNEG